MYIVNEMVRTMEIVISGSGIPRHNPPIPSSFMTSPAIRTREADSRED